jgi:predicted nucleic-acid-binding Zn-ribbon protein
MSEKIIPTIPNCRYEHGALKKVSSTSADKFGFIGVNDSGVTTMMFTGDLYVCTMCGYTELFDDDPQKTAEQEGLAKK